MKILMIGSNSFIAKSITPLLIKKGYNIISKTRAELDLTDINQLEDVLNKDRFDFIINTAVLGGRRTKEDSIDDFRSNMEMSLNLLECRNLYSNLINFCSAAIYGRLGCAFDLS